MPRIPGAFVALLLIARAGAAQAPADSGAARLCTGARAMAGSDSVPGCARGAAAEHAVRPAAEERAAIRDFYDLLAGRVPGGYVRRSGGEVGAVAQLTLRGASHLFAPDAPMLLVDGI